MIFLFNLSSSKPYLGSRLGDFSRPMLYQQRVGRRTSNWLSMAGGLVTLHQQMCSPRETVEPACVVIIQLMDFEPPASVVPLCPL